MGATLTLPEVSVLRGGDAAPKKICQPVGVEQTLLFYPWDSLDLILKCAPPPGILPAGLETKMLLFNSQGPPVETLAKTYRQKTQGVGRGQKNTSSARKTSYKGSRFPAGKKGSGKKVDIIAQHIKAHGVHRCRGFCEVCPSQPGECCHWENHRHPIADWLVCDCKIQEVRQARMEDKGETLRILRPDSRVEVIGVHITPACCSMENYAGLSEPTMILSARIRDITGETGWLVGQTKTRDYEK